MTQISIIVLFFICLGLLARKWEIDLKLAIPWVLFMGILSVVLYVYVLVLKLNGMYKYALAIASCIPPFAITIFIILILFYRDPDRICPNGRNLIISPADGKIIYIREIKEGKFPFSTKNNKDIPLPEFTDSDLIGNDLIHVGIAMNLLNVHVNRAPITGQVIFKKRISGKFKSLKDVSSLIQNERMVTIIQNDYLSVGVVQIASRLVRRINSYVDSGNMLIAGQRIGMIQFGSQVDLLISAKSKINMMIKEGQIVKAGESIVASSN